jgi:hypothetical protein
MAVDICFNEGEIQNFIVEIGTGTLNSPKDILAETGSNRGLACLETPLITNEIIPPPEMIMLSDGKIAKRISDTFYLKL